VAICLRRPYPRSIARRIRSAPQPQIRSLPVAPTIRHLRTPLVKSRPSPSRTAAPLITLQTGHVHLKDGTDPRHHYILLRSTFVRMIKVTYPQGRWLSFNYDERCRRTTMTTFDGFGDQLSLAAAGRLCNCGCTRTRYRPLYLHLAGDSSARTTATHYQPTTTNSAGQLLHLTNFGRQAALVNSRFDTRTISWAAQQHGPLDGQRGPIPTTPQPTDPRRLCIESIRQIPSQT